MSHFLISNVLQVGYTIKLEDKMLGETNLFALFKVAFRHNQGQLLQIPLLFTVHFHLVLTVISVTTRLCQAPFQVLSPTKNKTKQKKKKRGTVAIRIGRGVFCEENIMLVIFCKPE